MEIIASRIRDIDRDPGTMGNRTTCYRTSDARRSERFAYWREAVCDTYVQLGCETEDPLTFHGEIELRRLPKVSASVVSGSCQTVDRRKRDIARSDDAFFLLSLQIDRTCLVEQRGRETVLEKGECALYSSVDTYRLTLPDDFRQLVIQIPRQELLQRLPNADLLTARKISNSNRLGSLVSNSILKLAGEMNQSGELFRNCLQDTIVDLIATGLASLGDEALEQSMPEQQVLLRAETFIRSNLADPDLNRTMLAQYLGLSVRRLSQIYSTTGSTISDAIRDARLQRIATDLRDRRFERQSITDIAMRWGVNNLQHFSQVFRARFGQSPSDYRRSARSRFFN